MNTRLSFLRIAFLCFVVCTAFAENLPLDLPEGYELEPLTIEKEISPPFPYAFSPSWYQEPEDIDEAALAHLEEGPPSTVAGCVNVISGTFFDSQVDLTLPGAHPLIVRRTYNSADKKWTFQHMPLLEAGVSKSKRHLNAGYRDDSGSGMAYRVSMDSLNDVYKIPVSSEVVKKGLTNWNSGLINGQTNWKNSALYFVRKGKEKQYLLRQGSHTDRFFRRYQRYGKKHQRGAPIGKFHLLKEISPNGNELHYSYNDDNELTIVTATNPKGTLLAQLFLKQEKKRIHWFGQNSNTLYFLNDDKKIHTVVSPHQIPVYYGYAHDRIISKRFPDDRFIQINYESSHHRVKTLQAPVGTDKTPITTHYFSYDGSKDSGSTTVLDALNHRTLYKHDQRRLTEVIHYDNKEIYSKDRFFWGNSNHQGNLTTRLFEDAKKILFCRTLKYDSYGNVTENQLWGNLTGTNTISPEVDQKGNPKNNDCEVYIKTYQTSQDGWNLPLIENDGRKTIVSSYYPNSNLLKSRLIKDQAHTLKRQFFKYDDNAVPIEEINDDGTTEDPNDLTNVTERHLKIITPTKTFPIGLPHIIEEKYWENNAYHPLKKTINTHSLQGKILSQEHYDSDETLAYTLFWEYDNLGHITKEVNALGETTTYLYDANGNKTQELGPDYQIQLTYDCANRLIQEQELWQDGTLLVTTHHYDRLSQRTSTIDPFGQTTRYEYDPFGRLIATYLPPLGNSRPVERKEYDPMGHIISSTDPNGYCTKKAYTLRGQPYRIEYPDGSIERKEYTLDGLLIREIAKNGLITDYRYDALGRVIHKTLLDPQGTPLKSTSATYNSLHLLSETDEAGQTTYYTYDAAGRQSSSSTGHHRIEYRYDTLGRQAKIIQSGRTTLKEYDFLDRLIEERVEEEGQLLRKEQYRYNPQGQQTHLTTYTQAGPAITQTEYNPHGEPTLIIDPLGQITRFHYDYNPFLKITQTDPLGHQEIKSHDAHGNVSSLERRNPSGFTQLYETYTYDAKGQKIQTVATVYPEVAKQIITQWRYDSLGRIIQLIEAQGTPEEKTTSYFYNRFGQKEKILTPNGIELLHTYDILGRLAELKSSDNTIHYSYTYDIQDQPVTIQDRLNSTTTHRTYDPYGNLASETLATGYTLSYTYDPLDRPITIQLPDQSAINYLYNADQLITVERIKEGQVIYSHHYRYDLAGNSIEQKHLGQVGTTTTQYDLLQRPIITLSPHWQETASYDPAGNLLNREVTDGQGHLTSTYTYDDLYQLTSETGACSHTYQNDSLHNRFAKDGQSHTHNALNQLLSQNDHSYRYDANGNLTEKIHDGRSTLYHYDALDRLVEVIDGQDITTYTYDAFHRRLSKTHNHEETHYLYQGDNEIGALQNGTLIELRLLGLTRGAEIGAAVAVELRQETYAPIHDPYGHIVALVDSSGKLIGNYRYGAFGETQIQKDLPWGFAGKRLDPETGFIYFGRRYYSPEMGRWITADPLGYADGLNLYAYLHNQPLTHIDPDGQFAFLLVPIVASLAIDYCLPTIAACAAEYAGGALSAALVTGLAEGYTNSAFHTGVFDSLDPGTAVCKGLGICVGTYLSLSPTKLTLNSGKILASNMATGVTVNALWKTTTNNLTKATASQTARKTTHAAERQLVSKTTQATESALLAREGTTLSRGAESVNAAANLNRKLTQLQDVQQTAAHTRVLSDGRIRYYQAERQSRSYGPTRGSSYVVEYNPATGKVRGWNECYNHLGNVSRVHPKNINGQELISPHYPPTGMELIR